MWTTRIRLLQSSFVIDSAVKIKRDSFLVDKNQWSIECSWLAAWIACWSVRAGNVVSDVPVATGEIDGSQDFPLLDSPSTMTVSPMPMPRGL